MILEESVMWGGGGGSGRVNINAGSVVILHTA